MDTPNSGSCVVGKMVEDVRPATAKDVKRLKRHKPYERVASGRLMRVKDDNGNEYVQERNLSKGFLDNYTRKGPSKSDLEAARPSRGIRFDKKKLKAKYLEASVEKASEVEELPIPEWARGNFTLAPPRMISPLDQQAAARLMAVGARAVLGKPILPWQRSMIRAAAREMAIGQSMLHNPIGYGQSYS